MISLMSTTKGRQATCYFYLLFPCLCIQGLISALLPLYLTGVKLLRTLTTLILFRELFSRAEFLITHLLVSYLVPTCITLHLAFCLHVSDPLRDPACSL